MISSVNGSLAFHRVPKGGTGKDDDKKLTYGSYLQLDKLLSCVDLQSAAVSTPVHDEHLFIVTHQGEFIDNPLSMGTVWILYKSMRVS